MTEAAFSAEVASDRNVLRVRGAVDLVAHGRQWLVARKRLDSASGAVTVDLAGATLDDGSLSLLLAWRTALVRRGRACDIVGADELATKLIALRERRMEEREPDARDRPSGGAIERLGGRMLARAEGVRGAISYCGEVAAAFLAVVRRPSALNWRDFPRLIGQIGAEAVPIVLAVNFLVGITLAYMGAIQAAQFGANVFIADMVAIAVVRAIGPLITAVVIAGRSGAGIAAELGTMKVSEEIDALRTLGLDPMRFLVLPRALAVTIAFPLLTIAGEIAAMTGGLAIGVTQLGLTSEVYLQRTHDVLSFRHVGAGLLTAFFFGVAIVLIACRRGLATEGGAEGVGRATTTSVVQIIFQIVVIEALFTVIFNLYGI